MIAAYILIIPGVSNYDRGKGITLELYLTFKLLAGEDQYFNLNFPLR